jgi:thioredoxin 1
MNSENVVPVTDANFEELALRSSTPVLLDFGATWCPPCRAMDPHVDALAAAYAGRVRVGTCDIDDNQVVATHFRVQSVPTFVLLRDGKVLERVVGAMSRARLEALMVRGLG